MNFKAISRRTMLRLSAGSLSGAAMAALLPRDALAAFPDRYITMIVPFAPGGATDIVGRAISVHLTKLVGQSVVVENRPGAGGNIGIGAAAKAARDGYTILCISSAFVVNPSLYAKVPYDPLKDFVPISDLGASPNVIVADPKTGLRSLQDLVSRAKADPQLFNYSSAGAGTTPHLAAELLKIRAGINLTHVPYPGAGPALQAVLAGTVQLASLNLSVALPQIKAGTVTPLVQTGDARWPDLTDVPTMEEAGYPNSSTETFQALFAPAGTPPEIVSLLSNSVAKAARDTDFQSSMAKIGFKVTGSTSQALGERVTRELSMWRDVIDKAGIKLG